MISAPLHQALARARMDNVRGAADAHRVTHGRLERERSVAVGSVTRRFGSSADQPALERLAQLDSARPLAHPVLLGEVDGHLRAALALVGGAVVADPFYPAAGLIGLLRVRARQLGPTRRTRRPWRLRLRAVAAQPQPGGLK